MQSISRMGELTALTVVRRDSTQEDKDRLRALVPRADVRVFELSAMSRSSSVRNRLARLVRGILTLTPPLFFSPYSVDLSRFVHRHGSEFDVVILLGEAAGVYYRSFDGPHVIWDKANVFTVFCWNSVINLRSVRQKCKFLFNAGLSYLFERRVLRSVEAVWVTAPEEGPRLERLFGRFPEAVIRSAVPGLATNPRRFDPGSRSVVWLSTFGYPPNWDGLRRLVVEAAEDFRASGLRLVVVGAGASPQQAAFLKSHDFVEYRGYVEDLNAVFATAVAGIVPLWAGAGVKLKTITMMSHGLPVVSTTAGMEGIPLEAALFVSNSAKELVSAVASATEGDLSAASREGFSTVAANFSTSAFEVAVQEHLKAPSL